MESSLDKCLGFFVCLVGVLVNGGSSFSMVDLIQTCTTYQTTEKSKWPSHNSHDVLRGGGNGGIEVSK